MAWRGSGVRVPSAPPITKRARLLPGPSACQCQPEIGVASRRSAGPWARKGEDPSKYEFEGSSRGAAPFAARSPRAPRPVPSAVLTFRLRTACVVFDSSPFRTAAPLHRGFSAGPCGPLVLGCLSGRPAPLGAVGVFYSRGQPPFKGFGQEIHGNLAPLITRALSRITDHFGVGLKGGVRPRPGARTACPAMTRSARAGIRSRSRG